MPSNSPIWGSNYSQVNTNSNLRKAIARLFNKPSMRKDRRLMITLLGAAAGSTATETRKRIAHSTSELGGIRQVETVTLVNRATTAADDTDLTNNILAYVSNPSNAYAENRSFRFGDYPDQR